MVIAKYLRRCFIGVIASDYKLIIATTFLEFAKLSVKRFRFPLVFEITFLSLINVIAIRLL